MNVEDLITRIGEKTVVPAATRLFGIGDPCQQYVFVESGQIRVEIASLSGNQLLLYRIGTGQTCVLTTACLLSGESYTAQAITEIETTVWLVRNTEFQQWLKQSDAFRAFVFEGFSERLSAMIQRTCELTTSSVEQRLAAALLVHTDPDNQQPIAVTHEALAVEIGTAREVVSRRLAAFAAEGLITRSRGQLQVVDVEGVRNKLADSAGLAST